MSSRIVTTLRVIAGAIVGAIVGSIIVLVVSTAVAEALGSAESIGRQGGGVAGMIMMFYGVPLAIVVGAILGGWAAGTGRATSIFRFTAVTALALTGLAIVLAIVLPDNRPKPEVDAKGCAISRRVGSFAIGKEDQRYVVVYDRYCKGGEGHTVNVSAVPTVRDSILGPGNILVLAGELDGVSPSHVEAYADVRDSMHLVVRFDHRARVLAQTSPVEGFAVDFQPTIGLPLPPPRPPEPPAVIKAMIAAQQESLKAHMPLPSNPTTFVDSNGCTINRRSSSEQYARRFVVYARTCPTAPHRTIDVSLLAPEASIDGPGNVLVLATDETVGEDSARFLTPVLLRPLGPSRIDIIYDERNRIVSRGAPTDDVVITLRPGLRVTRGPTYPARPDENE